MFHVKHYQGVKHMLILTDTKTINTDRIAVIEYTQVSDNNFYIYCDKNIVIGHLSENVAKTLYYELVYSLTSGKKTFNVLTHLDNILKMYDFSGGVL